VIFHKKVTGKTAGMSVGILMGVLVGLSITLVSSAILAWLICIEKMKVETLGFCTAVVILIAAFAGALTAAAKIKRLRTQVCLITGGVYYLILLALTALFFDGRYQSMGVTAIFALVGCGMSALLGIKEKKKGKGKMKKRAFC